MTRQDGAGMSGEVVRASNDARDADASALVGTTFAGKYDIEALIGVGGMSRVFSARQQVLNREVALKVLEPPLGSALERETFDRMFLQEAATAAQLKSPHSITLYDFGQADDETLFLVMEFLEGRPLDQVLAEDAPLSARRAVHIAVQTCRSLREAHEKGLVHRDLKPANVMLVDRNNDPDFVKVLDFGIAKNRGAAGEDDEASLAGVFIGSPRYASPEQLQRRPDVDHRADIYACGLLIYALLVGEPPFDGTSRELLHKHLLEPPQPMDERNIDVPPSLAAVVYRCLEKDPAQRFADMTELIRALGGVTYTDGEQEPTTTDADMADFAAEIDLDETDDALLALRREQERRKRQLLISDQAAAEEITDEFAAAAHDSSTTQDIEAAPRRALWPWLLGALVVLALLSAIGVVGVQRLLAGRQVTPDPDPPVAVHPPTPDRGEAAADPTTGVADVVVEDAAEVGVPDAVGTPADVAAPPTVVPVAAAETERMAAPTEQLAASTAVESGSDAETETGTEAGTETETEAESSTEAPSVEGYKDDPY